MRFFIVLFFLQFCTLTSTLPAEEYPAAWEKSSPESQGIDSLRLARAITRFERHLGTTGFSQAVIVRGGAIIWEGVDSRNRHNVWSVSKSFTSTVLGLLIDDGKCALDDPVAKYLPALDGQFPSYGQITFRHFVTMTSGYDAGGDQSSLPFKPTEPLFSPGSKFLYWDSAMNQLANALTRVAGEPIEELFRRRIAGPVGMDPDGWDWGDWGTVDSLLVNGGAGNKSKGIHINARELARFGLLFLRGGRWNGKQVLSANWVRQATSVQVPVSVAPAEEKNGQTGLYGFNWWVNGVRSNGIRRWPAAPDGTFAARGHNNNACVVIPEWDMVITRLSLKGKEEDFSDPRWNEFFTSLKAALK